MRLAGCDCAFRQQGIGAMIVPAHYCWDGKTKVINDADCPPQPLPTAPAASPTPVAPTPVTPDVYDQGGVPIPTTPRSTPIPPVVMTREQFIPTVRAAAMDPTTYELVPVSATGGSAPATTEPIESAPAAEESSGLNWAVILGLLTLLTQ